MSEQTALGVPYSLAACFQEYNLDTLDPAQHGALMIERVLAYGNRRELAWLFAQYGHQRIADWIQENGARRLPWRRYHLWCVLLDLKPAPRPKGRERWPY